MNESIDSHIKTIEDMVEELIGELKSLRKTAKNELGNHGEMTVSMYEKRVIKFKNDILVLRDSLDDNEYGDSYNI